MRELKFRQWTNGWASGTDRMLYLGDMTDKYFTICQKGGKDLQTYPEMNKQIKKLLELGGQNYELYALQRIIELEQKVIEQQKEIVEIDESLHIARVGRRDLMAYVKQLQQELIEAYQKRGDMYMSGEKEWVDNRIKELNSQTRND